jgi:5'-nucleotidase (lipoprotein e(P4) family)
VDDAQALVRFLAAQIGQPQPGERASEHADRRHHGARRGDGRPWRSCYDSMMHQRSTLTAAALAAILATACASGPRPVAPAAPASPPTAASPATPAAVPAPSPAAPATAAPAPATTPAQPTAIRWARSSAEHEAALLQAFGLATRLVEQQAASRAPGTWAVISDADETLIDNSEYMKERAALGQPFTRPTWKAWCARRAATPLAGALEFAARVRALGGRLAIVTNRTGDECPDTDANLRSIGLPFDALLCRVSLTDLGKESRFSAVQAGTAAPGLPPLEVVLYVGDNVFDFPGLRQEHRESKQKLAAFGSRFVIIPNPMYGSWERLPER